MDSQVGGVGEKLYIQYCINCHQEDGSGLGALIPPLANADYWNENRLEIACLIRKGQKGPITVNGKSYNEEMPGFDYLTEYQVHQIIRYVEQSWGNEIGKTSLKEVRESLEKCP